MSGAAASHAPACARSSFTCRAAGFDSPFATSQAGQARVTMPRNSSVTRQCSACSASAARSSASGRSSSIRSASSIKAASSAASIHARSAVRTPPCAAGNFRISADSAASRCAGATAGGRSSAPSSANGASSTAPNAVIRGSSSARPSDTSRNASASERAARRVGNRISPRASSSAPHSPIQRRASTSRNGAPGGSETSLIVLRPRPAHEDYTPPRPDRAASRGGTTTRHAPARATAPPPARDPTTH